MKKRILLVDDKLSNLIVFEEVLSDIDVTFVQAHSGNEALQILEKNNISLILLDIQMPGISGFDTLKLIKKNTDWYNIPVILISAVYKNESYQIEGIKLGAVDFITKPVIPQLLLSKVKLFLELYEYRLKQNTKINEISWQLSKN